jgi:RNA polymerase sigma-70 factor (ECF subfamily)
MRVCLRRLGDRDEADDAVQETFARAWRALPRFDGSWRLYPWLRTIAGNVCTDVVRRRLRVQLTELDETHGGSVDPSESLASTMDARSDLERLRALIGDLPDRYRETLLLHEVEGYTSRQIAVSHGTSVRAVETVLVRARRILRSEMARPAAFGLSVTGAVSRAWRRLMTSRGMSAGLRDLSPAVSGALVSGVAAVTVLGIVLPNLGTSRPPAPVHPRPAVVTPAGGPTAPARTPASVDHGSSPAPAPPLSPSGGGARGGGSGWTPAPGVHVGPAAPSGYVMATSGPPWACFAVYEVNLGVCVSDPLPNQLP